MDFDMIFARDPIGANNSGTSAVGHQDDGTRYFIQHHPNIAIPYLITIIVSTLFGTVGNILIICAVLFNKVRSQLIYIYLYTAFIQSAIHNSMCSNVLYNYSYIQCIIYVLVGRRLQFFMFWHRI